MRRYLRDSSLLIALAVASACSDGSVAVPAPTQPDSTHAAGAVPLQAVTDEEFDEAVALRERYGLRADEAWIRAVAADPASEIGLAEFGIPLTPAEFADLMSRRWDPELHVQVLSYCRSVKEDCAGAYINQKASGVVVELTDNLEQHVDAITKLVTNPRLVEVRVVEWSLADLERFTERVEAERRWIEGLGVELMGIERSGLENFVQVRYISPASRADAIARVIEHHFDDPSWLEARWVGPPEWAGPRGTLTITITDAQGRPVPNVRCDLDSEEPEAPFNSAVPFGTGPDGVCVIENIPAVAYRVKLREWVDNDHDVPDPLGELRIVLRPSGTSVDVRVEPRSQSTPNGD